MMRTRLRTWTISDRTGDLLYQGEAASKKQFIEDLVRNGLSLAGADLRGLDLSHIDISGGDFTGADLSGASLRGAIAKEAIFDGAKLSGVRAEGMAASGASFANAVIDELVRRGKRIRAVFDGARLTRASFDAAIIDGASFEGCSLSGSSFCLARLLGVSFKDSRLNNVDWTRGRIMRCDFTDCEMFASVAAVKVPRSSLPIRTRECVAVGNTFDGAVLDDTLPAFSRDRRLNKLNGHLAWTLSTTALVLAAMHLPIEPSQDWFGQMLGQGVILAGALTLATLAKEKATEFVQEHLADYTLKAQMTMRAAVSDLIRRGGNLANSIVAMGRTKAISPLIDALRATEGDTHASPLLKAVSHMSIGDVDVIVCDRRRMAMAFEWISTSFSRTAMLDRDFVVVRSGDGDEAPRILKFFAGGGMAAIWSNGSNTGRIVVWDEDELVPAYSEAEGLTGTMAISVRRQFERAVLGEHLPGVNFDYDPTRQQLRAGRDGSIVITDTHTKLPRNKDGVILVTPNGGTYTEEAAKDLLTDDDIVASDSALSWGR